MSCEHEYTYAGVRYCDGTWPLPGTGAVRRYYAHVFFCSKCLDTQGKPIEDSGRHRTSYEQPKFNTVPGNAAECGVPMEDRSRY